MSPLQILMAISVPVLWGLGFTFSKAALDEFPPLMLMGMRFCLTALILVWFVPRPTGEYKRVFQIAVLGSAIQYGLTFSGLQYLDASTAVLVVQTEVPFGVIAAWLAYKERVGWIRWCGIVICFIGVVFISGSPQLSGQLVPVGLVVGGAFTWALAQVMVKSLKHTQGFTLIAWLAVFAGPIMLLASLVLEDGQIQALQNASWIGWGTIAYLAIFMTAIGYGIFYKLLIKFPVSVVMPYLLLLPVVGVLGSVFILGEQLTSTVIIGGVIVIGGVAAIELFGEKHKHA